MHVVKEIEEDKLNKYKLTSRRKNGRVDSDWRDPKRDIEVIRRYNELIESPEFKLKRSYRNDSKYKHVWTKQDIDKFKVAFRKYGYGPTSNKKIADYIGNGIHPNHVAYFKQRIRKLSKDKLFKDELKERQSENNSNSNIEIGNSIICKNETNEVQQESILSQEQVSTIEIEDHAMWHDSHLP